jgi:prepilin-type N-terminal cleavage/methylation domain-containing protein
LHFVYLYDSLFTKWREKKMNISCLKNCKYKNAFTLVELLVVVFIIALLVGLLLPRLRDLQEMARSAHCKNNLREYGVEIGENLVEAEMARPGKSRSAPTGAFNRQGDAIEIEGEMKPLFRYEGATGDKKKTAIQKGMPTKKDISGVEIDPDTVGGKAYLDFELSSDVRHCPSVDWQGLTDSNSPMFKDAERTSVTLDAAYWDEQYAWDQGWVETNEETDIAYIIETTYAINPYVNIQDGKLVPIGKVAYIDWNAEEGWKGQLLNNSGPNGYAQWMFDDPSKGISEGESKGNYWWMTEVGFHHPYGGEYGANYVVWDGHVEWVSSNDIDKSYFVNE